MYPGPAWQMLREGNTVPVVYLPSAPDWNRLVSGEDVGAEFGGKSLFLFSGGFLMFSFMAVVCLLGYDLKTENGVTRLTRHGRVIKEWRQKPTP